MFQASFQRSRLSTSNKSRLAIFRYITTSRYATRGRLMVIQFISAQVRARPNSRAYPDKGTGPFIRIGSNCAQDSNRDGRTKKSESEPHPQPDFGLCLS